MAYNNTYQISGEIGVNTSTTPQTDILSDIRSIEGVTIVTFTPKNEEESAASNRNYVGILSVKFDTFPFTEFDKDTQIKILVDQIRKMPGVNYFKIGQVNLLETRLKSLVKEMLLEKKTKRDRCLRIADRKFDKPSAYKSGAVVRCRKGEIWKELKEGKYDDTSNFDLVKQNLFNIKKLVDKGILFVTKPGDGKGGVEEPNWEGDASIITLYNMSNAEPWMKEAVKNPIPQAIPYIQKDQSKLLYNGKYNQILWSIEKKGLKPEDFYLSLKEQLDRGLSTPWLNEILTEKQKETLRTWFKRQGAPGKTGGWVDCNSPIRKDGKITGYKPCGRQKGEERAKYPSCRPTASKCKDPGKGKTWGKTKNESLDKLKETPNPQSGKAAPYGSGYAPIKNKKS